MSGYSIIDALKSWGVAVVAPTPGRIQLLSPAEQIPPAAVEIAIANKPALLAMLARSSNLGECPACGSALLAVPTFDGYENFECIPCDRCSGCREVTQ